jgi:hypothetical protein
MNGRRIEEINPSVFPHYVTPARIVGFLVVGPKLVEDARFDTEDEALEEAAKRIAAYTVDRITIHRIETHLEVIK